jgi:hypothetical protein
MTRTAARANSKHRQPKRNAVAIQYQSSSRHSQLPPTLSPYSELYAMPNESPILLNHAHYSKTTPAARNQMTRAQKP